MLGIPVTIAGVLLVFNGLYIYGNYPDQFHPLWIPFVLLLLILAAMVVYGFPLLARYQLKLGQVIGNALIFFIRNLKLSVFATLFYFLPALVFLFLPGFLSNFLFLWVLPGSSTVASSVTKNF